MAAAGCRVWETFSSRVIWLTSAMAFALYCATFVSFFVISISFSFLNEKNYFLTLSGIPKYAVGGVSLYK